MRPARCPWGQGLPQDPRFLIVYIDGQQAVIYLALRPNPGLGANFVALDPLEWLARITDHIPDPGRHRTLFYAHYANRARGARAKEKKLSRAPEPWSQAGVAAPPAGQG